MAISGPVGDPRTLRPCRTALDRFELEGNEEGPWCLCRARMSIKSAHRRSSSLLILIWLTAVLKLMTQAHSNCHRTPMASLDINIDHGVSAPQQVRLDTFVILTCSHSTVREVDLQSDTARAAPTLFDADCSFENGISCTPLRREASCSSPSIGPLPGYVS